MTIDRSRKYTATDRSIIQLFNNLSVFLIVLRITTNYVTLRRTFSGNETYFSHIIQLKRRKTSPFNKLQCRKHRSAVIRNKRLRLYGFTLSLKQVPRNQREIWRGERKGKRKKGEITEAGS